MGIGENIWRLRKEVGLTQRELAQMVGVDQSSVAQWVHERSKPRVDTVSRIAEAPRVGVGDIVPAAASDDVGGGTLVVGRGVEEAPIVGHAWVPFVALSGGVPEELLPPRIEVPTTLVERHPNAVALIMEDDGVDRLIPMGLAAVYDPDLRPRNGNVAVVALDGRVAVRRWYHGNDKTLLVAESHAVHEDIVIDAGVSAHVLGSVVWVQSASFLDDLLG